MRNEIKPPRIASKFLHWFCDPAVIETLEGDLVELYRKKLESSGRFKADLSYTFDVIGSLRSFALRKRKRENQNISIAMLQHYLRIGWRNLARQKILSLIKIGGFAIGFAACLVIALLVKYDLAYDQHYCKQDQIFRVVERSVDPDDAYADPFFPAPIGPALLNDYPEIEKVVRIIAADWFDAGENQFQLFGSTASNFEDGFVYADPDYLSLFEIPMLFGTQDDALAQPNRIVISKEKAERYFQQDNPVGQTIYLNGNKDQPFEIGGVMANQRNSHLNFNFVITLKDKEFWPGEQNHWGAWNYIPYIQVKEHTKIAHLEEKIQSIKDDYITPYLKSQGSPGADRRDKYTSLFLQPIGDIFLHSAGIDDEFEHGDIRLVWLFSAIAFFILLLACINFINLSTARSAGRAKEVGLQKVLGSQRSSLIKQFLTESIIYSTISVVVGLLVVALVLPYVREITNKNLVVPWSHITFISTILMGILAVGLIAGLYPAIYLSGHKPNEILRGRVVRTDTTFNLRNGLVVFQFSTSIILMICAIVTFRQMDMILHKNLGYDRDQVLLLHGVNALGTNPQVLKTEIEKQREVVQTSFSEYLPVSGTTTNYNSWWLNGREKLDESASAQIWRVDPEYTETLGLKIVEGRNFSEKIDSDSTGIILNQTMVRKLGLTNPIGREITNNFQPPYHVIGVVEDFHFESLRDDIDGLCLAMEDFGSTLLVKLHTDDISGSLQNIEKIWHKIMPHQTIRYEFLDDRFEKMYANVRSSHHTFTIFTLLAIFIAGLGLFGLSTYLIEQRSKEISIRKVLGASVANILQILTLNYATLVAVSMFVSIPIATYLMQRWLNDYTYRIGITWDIYVIAGCVVLSIAMLIIGRESLKAATRQPVEVLRS